MLLSANKMKIFILSLILSVGSLNAAQSGCLSKNFSIKVAEEASLGEVINQLSDMCNFSVIAKDAFSKKSLGEQAIGINIKNMPLSGIFDILLSEKNLNYEFANNVLKISALKTKTFKIDYITSIREGKAVVKANVDSNPKDVSGDSSSSDSESSDSTNSDNIITSTEKFDFWAKIDAELKAIINNSSEELIAPDPIINPNAGLITVTAMPSQLKRVEKYIEDMQKRLKKQVIIDVSIISVTLNNEYSKGVDWSQFQLSFGSSIGKNWTNKNNRLQDGFERVLTANASLNLNIDGVLNFLETNGKAKVVSSPKVTTLNNQQAIISVGDTINYRIAEEGTSTTTSDTVSTTYTNYSMFIGILLNLLPEVSDDNKIMLRINPSLSSFKYREDDAKQNTPREIAPDTLQKKLSTVVHVNSGDTIILGGLIGQTKGKDNTKVPLLGDLPLIGNAFKSTTDRVKTEEIIFVITPRVVDIDNTDTQNTLKELGFSKSIYE